MSFGHDALECLKVIHWNFNREVAIKVLGADKWPCPEELDVILEALRKDVFYGLCAFDDYNLELVFAWARNFAAESRARRQAFINTQENT